MQKIRERLERELLAFGGLRPFLRDLRLLRGQVLIQPLDEYRLDGLYRARGLARAAPDADGVIGLRAVQPRLILHEVYRMGGAYFRARPAREFLPVDDASRFFETHLADLDGLLGREADRLERSGGADLGAFFAVVLAERVGVIHPRDKHPGQSVLEERRFQHAGGAVADADVASGTP